MSVEIIFEDDNTILYSDGGMNKTTGDEAWGSVVQQDGKDMIGVYPELLKDMNLKEVFLPRDIDKRTIATAKFNDVATQQHNGAELLALVVALRIAKESESIICIKCDSATIISWSQKGPQSVTKAKMDKNKLMYIEEAIKLRKEFEKRGGVIEKISGDDNKADLGYHR
jgi:ribonuclease HI